MKLHKGFTFTELMTVIVIIGILLAGWGLRTKKITEHSSLVLKKNQRIILVQAIDSYYKKYNKYPLEIIELKKEGFISEDPSFSFNPKKNSSGGIYDIE